MHASIHVQSIHPSLPSWWYRLFIVDAVSTKILYPSYFTMTLNRNDKREREKKANGSPLSLFVQNLKKGCLPPPLIIQDPTFKSATKSLHFIFLVGSLPVIFSFLPVVFFVSLQCYSHEALFNAWCHWYLLANHKPLLL
jgi:hypothetical protein